MSAIDTVVCDFGGVLTTPLLHAFAALQEHHDLPLESLGIALHRIAEEDHVNPLFALETGELSEQDFTAKLEAALAGVLDRPVTLGSFGELYFAHLDPNEELIAYMRELKGRGYRMGILTNNVREWEALWRAKLPVDEIFDDVVDSGWVGMRKPDPGIYALTLERLGAAPERTVFLDDTEVNCAAARELGWHAVRFEDNAQAMRAMEAVLGG